MIITKIVNDNDYARPSLERGGGSPDDDLFVYMEDWPLPKIVTKFHFLLFIKKAKYKENAKWFTIEGAKTIFFVNIYAVLAIWQHEKLTSVSFVKRMVNGIYNKNIYYI